MKNRRNVFTSGVVTILVIILIIIACVSCTGRDGEQAENEPLSKPSAIVETVNVTVNKEELLRDLALSLSAKQLAPNKDKLIVDTQLPGSKRAYVTSNSLTHAELEDCMTVSINSFVSYLSSLTEYDYSRHFDLYPAGNVVKLRYNPKYLAYRDYYEVGSMTDMTGPHYYRVWLHREAMSLPMLSGKRMICRVSLEYYGTHAGCVTDTELDLPFGSIEATAQDVIRTAHNLIND